MLLIKQSESTAARRRIPIYLVDATDGYTPETGLSSGFTIEVSKNGATQGAGGGSITEIGEGQYYYEATQGELDTLGFIAISIRHASCRDVFAAAQIVAFDPYDNFTTNINDIETDTNEIQTKLPTNNIMGSSVKTDKDDEIDAIKTKTDNLPANTASELDAIDSALSTAQADLDNPNQYKADVSGLATSAALSTHDGKLDTVDTIVDAIKAKTDNLPADPTSETNATTNKNSIITEINANETKIDTVDTVVDAIKAKTDNLKDSWNDLSAAQMNAEVDSALAEIDLDHLIQVSAGAEKPTIGSYLDKVMNKDGSQTFDQSTDALEAIRDAGGGATDWSSGEKEQIRDALGVDGTKTTATNGQLQTIDTVVDAIKTKTDNLPADPTSETNATSNKNAVITEVNANETKIDTIDGIVDNILIDTNEMQGKLPTNNIMGSSVKTAKDDEIDAIKTKTDNLPANTASELNDIDSALSTIQTDLDNPNQYKADVSGLATSAALSTHDGKLDTVDGIVDAIKTKTDNLPANTNDFLTRILGLGYENSVAEYSYSGDNNISGGIWIYNSKANAQTHDKSTGLVGYYAMIATFSSGKITKMTITKES